MIDRLLPGISHLQNAHPLFVHYPIAFLAGAVVFYIVAWAMRNDRLAAIAFAMLLAGTLTGAAAIASGLYAQQGVMVARSVRAALLEQHRTLMLSAGGVAVALSVWALIERPFPRRARPLFVLLLLVLLGVLFKGADDGGRMVYDYNAGGSACGQPIDFTK